MVREKQNAVASDESLHRHYFFLSSTAGSPFPSRPEGRSWYLKYSIEKKTVVRVPALETGWSKKQQNAFWNCFSRH